MCLSIIKGLQNSWIGAKTTYAFQLEQLKKSNLQFLQAVKKNDRTAMATLQRLMWNKQYPAMVMTLQSQQLTESWMALALQRKVEVTRQLWQMSFNQMKMYMSDSAAGFDTWTTVGVGEREVDDMGL